MIQRIQSIYLILASAVAGGLIFVCNLWSSLTTNVFAIDLFNESELLKKIIPVLFIVSAIISFCTIFLFKNRQLQFVLGRIVILINFFLLGILVYVSLTLSGEAAVSKKGIGMFLPLVVVLLLVLANKAIKKDEDLVKSVDRLR
ncbi:uncharacterized protein DUF4293 [Lutibacter sp. Hel_I_33_5]|uniref:DUF4293 domain-containing protein n=1 Tax=Lutibacter sp. Hel_I_33_5 TaxID=1566289 RepID=UPI00119D0722|nr:DUF4293 domain-containing protein [Lutibacter sp. Hel_I_33_5]TVZ55806.1 uncharacterized protein DUF4293 [Lutibacter sp. Hel_I_33_5]